MIYIKKIPVLSAIVGLLFILITLTVSVVGAQAQALSERSLMVTSTVASDDLAAPDGTSYVGLTAGDPRNGQKVGHTYSFTASSMQNLEGFTIEYCDSAFGYIGTGACDDSAFTGFSASAWNGGTVGVTSPAGTKIYNITATTNTLILTNNDALVVNQDDQITINFPASNARYFVNPDTDYKEGATNGTYFAHIGTYATSAAATNGIANDTGFVDEGTVTNSVTTSIGIYTRVQETLNFSVEGHKPTDPAGPSSTTTGSSCPALTRPGDITIGDANKALSYQIAHHAKSYFRLSTNSGKGTSVFYAGGTLSSGTNNINPIGPTRQASTPGSEQFGLAFDLTDNLNGNVGISGQLIPELPYDNNANGYAFDTSTTNPKLLASAPGIVSCDTGSMEYVANISTDTPAGIYQTKINYIAASAY